MGNMEAMFPTLEQANEFGRRAGAAMKVSLAAAVEQMIAGGRAVGRLHAKAKAELEAKEAAGALSESEQAALNRLRELEQAFRPTDRQ